MRNKRSGNDFGGYQSESTVGLDMRGAIPKTPRSKPKASDIALIFLCIITYVPILTVGGLETAFQMTLLAIAVITAIALLAHLLLRDAGWAWWGCTVTWLTGIEIANVALINTEGSSLALALVILFLISPIVFSILTWRKFGNLEIVLKLVGMVVVINLAIFVGVKYVFP